MKNAIYEYIELTDEEKNALWDTATFVFDTNVLLNLYRYTAKTRDSLLQAIEDIKDRIWIPHHVAEEFMMDRYDVFSEGNSIYSEIRKKKDDFFTFCSAKLRLNGTDPQIVELKNKIDEWITNLEKQDPRAQSFSQDPILNRILLIFDGKVGGGFDSKTISSIEKEGKDRYDKKIPPGYLDHKKTENIYGDLIIWKEILHFSKENEKDIIFITDDQKDDWWKNVKGKTIGPRPEIRKEFYRETSNRRFHMYSMNSFISLSINKRGELVDNTIIEEIDAVSKKREITVDLDENHATNLLYESQLKDKLVSLRDRLEEDKEQRERLHKSSRHHGDDSQGLELLLVGRQLDDSIRQKEKEIKIIEDELAVINAQKSFNRKLLSDHELINVIG